MRSTKKAIGACAYADGSEIKSGAVVFQFVCSKGTQTLGISKKCAFRVNATLKPGMLTPVQNAFEASSVGI